MVKIIRSNKYDILRLAYQQVQIFARFQLNVRFMIMMNQFGNSNVISIINEIIVALKINEKRKKYLDNFLWIWLSLLKKSLIENVFCAVT